MSIKFKVNEIFRSIDGEGIRTGLPVTFIRLYGCNLKCSYCDTQYSCKGQEFEWLSINEIIKKVYELGERRITLTGGEPLIQPKVDQLIERLVDIGCEVNIETNGAVDIAPYVNKKNVIITMDYKCSCSGMEDKMILNNIDLLTSNDVLKFVVGNQYDLGVVEGIAMTHRKARIYVSPVFGMIEPYELVEYVLDHNLHYVTVQVQLHKIIWNPNKRGV